VTDALASVCDLVTVVLLASPDPQTETAMSAPTTSSATATTTDA
jgi:hypothetical protein